MAISKRTLTRHLNQLMKLEADQMVRVSSVVTQARNELAAKMEANPQLWQGGSLDRSLRETLELIPQLADERFDVEALVTEGITEGKELVVEESGAFPGSLVDLYSPTLDLAAVAAKRSEFNGLIRDVTDDLAARIETEIRVSIISGEGTQDTLDRILGTGLQGLNGRDGVFRAAKFRAEMIARTEANDVINMGKQTTYSQMNAEFEDLGLRKKWDNIGDGRTSDICRELIGRVVDVDESFVSSRGSWQRPPAHPFCRSTIVPTSDGWSVPKDNKKKRENLATQEAPEIAPPEKPNPQNSPIVAVPNTTNSQITLNTEALNEARARIINQVGEEKVKAAEENLKRLLAENDIYIRVPGRALPDIIKEGRLKNSVEFAEDLAAQKKREAENREPGEFDDLFADLLDDEDLYDEDDFSVDYDKRRRDAENLNMGIALDVPGRDRPIYGYTADSNMKSLAHKAPDGYGNVAVKLKPEVKARTSVMGQDSFSTLSPASMREDPNIASFTNGSLLGTSTPEENLKTINAITSANSLDDLLRETKSPYIEHQIRGGVSVDDIDELVFTGGSKPPKSVLAWAKENKVTIRIEK